MISQACDTELRTSPLRIGTNNGRWPVAVSGTVIVGAKGLTAYRG